MGIGDRHDRHRRELFIERHQVRNVETSVKRRHVRDVMAFRQREVKVIDMKMDHVKTTGLPEDPLQQQHVMRQLIDALLVEPQGFRAGRDEPRFRNGISACKKRDIMALAHEFFRQI